MQIFIEISTIILVLIGTFFSFLGVLGYIRLPDIYTRLHATGKVGIFGAALLTLAAVVATPLTLGRGLVLIFFLLVTGPVVSHAIASAAYRSGVPLCDSGCDELSARQAKPGEMPHFER
ncbi:MAG: monovalent cation/H(+) antiporter subunit G [Anaerolineales bacterium]